MILLIDNYDSFTYNLYQMIGGIHPDIRVVRNDALHVLEICNMDPSHIVLSPGPGRPADSGVCKEVVRIFGRNRPVLGICLGHQAICEVYGGTVGYAKTLMHGKPSSITQKGNCALFAGLPEEFQGARYHSLAIDENTLPDCLEITARADDGEIMAVRHREYPAYGLQFHPESILTPLGTAILKNFLATEMIGRAELSDVEEILRLQYAAYQSEAALHDDYTIQPLTQTMEESIEEYHKSVVLKAVLDGEIIGSVRAREENGTAYIGKMMVRPDHQGKGVGRRLLAAIEREFPNCRFELFTACKSDRNLALYESAGYTRFRQETNAAKIDFAYLEKEGTQT